MEKSLLSLSRPRKAAARPGVLVLLLCWLLLPAGLRAATMDGLFETQVPVQGRDTAQRNQAIQQALGRVLIKVSGYRDIPGRRELTEEELAQAPRYVEQFRYLAGEQTGDRPAERLRVEFDGAAVTRLLREKGLPVWGEVRPAVLIWLGLEGPNGRRWYVPDTDPAGWDTLHRTAEDRGLPLLLPLLDLEDQSSLTAAELWKADEQAIRAASERYGPDAILIATLTDLGGAWRGSWTLLQDTSVRWQSRPAVLDESLAAGVNWAADALAARYAPLAVDSGGGLVELRVSGVLGLADYGLVEAHLSSLSMVEQSRLLAVEPGVARFQLRVSGGGTALARGIAVGGLLEPDPQAEEAYAGPDVLPVQGGGEATAADLSGDAGTEGPVADPSRRADAAVLSYRVRQ